MEKKKCVVIYGEASSGKSILWDYVMGYKWHKSLMESGNKKKVRILPRHLPDGIYSNYNIGSSIFNKILLIAQSLEETQRASIKHKILTDVEFDILFISVQKRVQSKTLEYLIKNYDVKLFEIENSSDRKSPQINSIEIFKKINEKNLEELAPQYAEIIRNNILNW